MAVPTVLLMMTSVFLAGTGFRLNLLFRLVTQRPLCFSSERGQNESVPLNATLSTSCSDGCVVEQLPSGLRDSQALGADRAGEGAARIGEQPDAADDLRVFLERPAEQAVVRVDGERGAHGRVDEVHGALGIDQIVAADVGWVAGLREISPGSGRPPGNTPWRPPEC